MDLLFSSEELDANLAGRLEEMEERIRSIDEQTILDSVPDELGSQVAESFVVNAIELNRDDWNAEDLGEARVDVSHEWDRVHPIDGRRTMVDGRSLVVRVPFTGEPDLFFMQASTFTMSPPAAQVSGSSLVFRFDFPSDRPPNIRDSVSQTLDSIEQHLGWQRQQINAHNTKLVGIAKASIERRKERILSDRSHLDSLGIPVRARSDAPKTYASSVIERKPNPRARSVTGSGSSALPTPVLAADFFEHICEITRSWGASIERSPNIYASHDEESLRDQLLAMLNSHYSGKAVGEAFQVKGKTDILVREEDRNLFVGECKWWSGPKAFSEAIDQLLSYSTWRDLRLALIVFVPAKEIAKIVDKARSAIESRDDFKGWVRADNEGELRANLQLPSGEDQEAILHTFLLHLPR